MVKLLCNRHYIKISHFLKHLWTHFFLASIYYFLIRIRKSFQHQKLLVAHNKFYLKYPKTWKGHFSPFATPCFFDFLEINLFSFSDTFPSIHQFRNFHIFKLKIYHKFCVQINH